MLKPIFTTKFKKDVIISQKRGKNLKKLEKIIDILVKRQEIPRKYHDHKLVGNYNNRRDCHIEPDWILIYKIEGNTIIFERTGSHSDLF